MYGEVLQDTAEYFSRNFSWILDIILFITELTIKHVNYSSMFFEKNNLVVKGNQGNSLVVVKC